MLGVVCSSGLRTVEQQADKKPSNAVIEETKDGDCWRSGVDHMTSKFIVLDSVYMHMCISVYTYMCMYTHMYIYVCTCAQIHPLKQSDTMENNSIKLSHKDGLREFGVRHVKTEGGRCSSQTLTHWPSPSYSLYPAFLSTSENL